jgi:putative transposase
MDEPHLFAAIRYLALNPVKAGLVARAADWPWSSVRAQLRGRDDELVKVAPLHALIPDFAEFLDADGDGDALARIESGPTIGRPLGAADWVAALEARLGRPLAPRKRGPKPRTGRAAHPLAISKLSP